MHDMQNNVLTYVWAIFIFFSHDEIVEEAVYIQKTEGFNVQTSQASQR